MLFSQVSKAYNDFTGGAGKTALNATLKVGSTIQGGALKSAVKGNTQLQKNKAAGDAYEKEILDKISSNTNNSEIVQQITVKTQSGVKKRIDIMHKEGNTGDIRCVECKASKTAPLTKNQKVAFPEIAETGGVVVGKGKHPFTGGTIIPPTQINIIQKIDRGIVMGLQETNEVDVISYNKNNGLVTLGIIDALD